MLGAPYDLSVHPYDDLPEEDIMLLDCSHSHSSSSGRGRRGSDPDQLARLTRLPSLVWVLLMLVANLAGLVVGGATLAPDLVQR